MGFSRQEYWSVEKEMATHSSILSWRIPWISWQEPGRLQSVGSNKKKKKKRILEWVAISSFRGSS